MSSKRNTDILVLNFILIFFGAFKTCRSAETQINYPQEIKRIINRGYLKIGLYHKEKPPFVMIKENGELYGLDIDLAYKIGKAMGVKVQFVRSAQTYSELVEQISRAEVDMVICKLSSTMTRAMRVLFSQPYLVFRQGLAMNKKFLASNSIPSDYPVKALKKRQFNIGIRERTSYVDYARELFPKANIVEDNWENLINMLKSGELDAVMRDEYTFVRMLKKNPDMALYFSLYILTDRKDPIAIGLPPNSNNLHHWLNLFLSKHFPVEKTAGDLITEYPELLAK